VPSIHNLWFGRLDRVRTTNDRTFWVAFAGAALVHALLIFGASSSTPKRLGEADGLLEAINVEFIEPEIATGTSGLHEGEPSAQALSTSALPRPEAPADASVTSATADTPKTPVSQSKPQQQALLSRPDPEAQREEEVQKEPPKETPKEQQKEPQKEPPKDAQKTEPQKEQKQQKSTASKSPPSKEKQGAAQLDFSLPSNFSVPSGGGASAVMRPAGITRSGENDDFGRDVIRALRKTMPPHERIYGRVTVRILLSPNGDVVELQLLRGSGSSYLDQVVMFSARQAVYPFPPKASTSLDRTFVVTYIYG
jgi:TonB family protein